MDLEGTSDVYVEAQIGSEQQATDIHYRCMDGAASFNYRLKLPYSHRSTKDNGMLKIKCIDNDFIG